MDHVDFKKTFFLFTLAMIAPPSLAYAACASPAGVAGEMGYNITSSGAMEYCDGTNWIEMSAPPESSLNNKFVSHWKLDETSGYDIADSVGSNDGTWDEDNDNTPTGSDDVSAETTTGSIDNALTFNGVYKRILLGDISEAKTLPMSISAWFYPVSLPSNGGGPQTIVSKYDFSTGSSLAWRLAISNTDKLFVDNYGSDCTGQDDFRAGTTLTAPDLNQWHHAVFTWDTDGTLKIYYDGAEVTTDTFGTSLCQSTTEVAIGNGIVGNQGFNGSIDDVRLYSRILTAEEVESLYNKSYGLIGHWKLDETTGTSITDSSPSGNDGTFSGETAVVSTTGQIGTALTFDGSDDKIEIPAGTNLNSRIQGPFTISAWIYPIGYGGASRGVIFDISNSTSKNYFFSLYSDKLYFVADHSTTKLDVRSSVGSISLSTWQHVALSWDGSTSASGVKMYIDGVETSYSTQQDAVGSYDEFLTTPAHIGILANGGRAFDGYIDDVRFYDRVLTDIEVANLVGCSTPGEMDYNSTDHVLQWCDSTYALQNAGTPGAGGGGCAAAGTKAAGVEGTMQYDTTNNKMVFCDGASWVDIPN